MAQESGVFSESDESIITIKNNSDDNSSDENTFLSLNDSSKNSAISDANDTLANSSISSLQEKSDSISVVSNKPLGIAELKSAMLPIDLSKANIKEELDRYEYDWNMLVNINDWKKK